MTGLVAERDAGPRGVHAGECHLHRVAVGVRERGGGEPRGALGRVRRVGGNVSGLHQLVNRVAVVDGVERVHLLARVRVKVTDALHDVSARSVQPLHGALVGRVELRERAVRGDGNADAGV